MWVGGRGGSALLSDLVAQTTEGRATQREGLMARVRQEGHLPKGMKYTKALVWKETPFLGLRLAFQLLCREKVQNCKFGSSDTEDLVCGIHLHKQDQGSGTHPWRPAEWPG